MTKAFLTALHRNHLLVAPDFMEIRLQFISYESVSGYVTFCSGIVLYLSKYHVCVIRCTYTLPV